MGFGIQSTKKKAFKQVEKMKVKSVEKAKEKVQTIPKLIEKPAEQTSSSNSTLIIHSKKQAKNRLSIGITTGTSVRKNKTVIVSPVENIVSTRTAAIAIAIAIPPKVEYTLTKPVRKTIPEKVSFKTQYIEETIETIEIPVIEKIVIERR
jgi:hypothetical protein